MLKNISARLASGIQFLIFGPWVVWKRRFPERQVTIALQQRLLGVIFPVSILIYILAPGLVSAMALAGLMGMLLWALIWARQMALHVSAQRVLRYHAVQVGDELEEGITLTNRSSAEVLWAEIVDHSNLPGYSMISVRAAGGRETVHWRVRATCQQRGVFQLGPWELVLGDPLGVFHVTQAYSARREVLVYPQLAELPRRLLPHQRITGDNRPLRQMLPAETSQALTARRYTPGDPLRRIHWRTTARKETLYTRQFEPEAASRVWLVPDFDIGIHLTYEGESTLETVVTLTATLAAQLLSDHLEVGLAAYANQQRVLLPASGPAQLWPMLLALAPLKAAVDQPLSITLTRIRPLIHARDLVIVITPSISPDWPVHLRRLSAASQGGSASVYLLDPVSYGGKQAAQGMLPMLAGLGIQAQVIRKGGLNIRPAAYGPLSRWQFKTLATGRVIVVSVPTTEVSALPGARLPGGERSP